MVVLCAKSVFVCKVCAKVCKVCAVIFICVRFVLY